ncbi:DUF6688 domain-containing protein [Winogradskyella thalassocola]|uniref:Uncharacterized protein n=1 Tax=Winogradskyella thalassocola TaxID=262004 RepID=A0A1G8CTN5_9FLAO|nr:DUF6688 family protein [Winogradskyella thalassocola]SDH48907.1 hypothetical protein SAMN04489796_10347 [Winogradskyella thalassocola]
MFPIIFLLVVIPISFVVFNFIYYIIKGRIKTTEKIFKTFQIWSVVIVPASFIINADVGVLNDCCTDSALFSPEHRIGIYTLLITYTLFYCISIFRKNILPPIAELFTNSFLILGLIINVLLCFHIHPMELGVFLWILGNVPVILLLFMELNENQKRLKHHIEHNDLHSTNSIGKLSLSILKLEPIYKYPILALILVPLLILLSLFLLIFGQKPDSIISAFTETYKHGFSQLDHLCDNVECGGHFLCSVGANGHQSIVKPIRYGERHGNKIICNRQLLISNAFEDLIQDKCPKIHNIIRKNYNNVGNLIHKYYYIFNIKLVSDVIYILIKPLELFFLFILYTFDNQPENRIAIQYLSKKDRQKLSALKVDTTT